jgi:energy-coupling factor transporter ATP-binding protein EcfA2
MKYIVTLLGPAGSGKSTLIERLSDILPVDLIYCHKTQESTTNSPAELLRSLQDDTFVERFHVDSLLARMHEFKNTGCSIAERNHELLNCYGGSRFMLLETDIGNIHVRAREYIDIEFWLSLPAEIALSRKILRDIKSQADGSVQNTCNLLASVTESCNRSSGILGEAQKLWCYKASRFATHWINASGSIDSTLKQILPVIRSVVDGHQSVI